VYWVIFLRPISPSFESFSRYGQTTVKSCRMIDAEMYGMIPRAKTESLRSAPPEKMSRKPKSDPADERKNASIAAGSTPGVGMCDPRRYTASRRNVKMTRLRRSGTLKIFARL
jgi:hypothetical protein